MGYKLLFNMMQAVMKMLSMIPINLESVVISSGCLCPPDLPVLDREERDGDSDEGQDDATKEAPAIEAAALGIGRGDGCRDVRRN